jgi:hypothetical protein
MYFQYAVRINAKYFPAFDELPYLPNLICSL